MNGTMDETRRADILRKIRGLIAHASDRSIGEAEAATFRAKADALMTKFAVDEFEAMQSGPTSITPEVRDVDMTWWYGHAAGNDPDANSSLHQMWYSVYSHCRCVPVYSKTDPTRQTMKVAGFPTDLDYADMLFTSLSLQMIESINPSPDPNLGLIENYHRLFNAGLGHDECFRRLLKAGFCEEYTGPIYNGYGDRPTAWVNYHKPLLNRYQAWRRQQGITARPNPANYRRSFSEGFVSQVADRLYTLRREDADRTSQGGTSYALVLRNIRDIVQEFLYEEYPELRPRPVEARTQDTVKKGRRVATPRDNRKTDMAAYRTGRDAGDAADIMMSPGKRVANGNAGELEN